MNFKRMDSSFSDMTVLNRFKIPNVFSFQTLCCTTIQHQLVGSYEYCSYEPINTTWLTRTISYLGDSVSCMLRENRGARQEPQSRYHVPMLISRWRKCFTSIALKKVSSLPVRRILRHYSQSWVCRHVGNPTTSFLTGKPRNKANTIRCVMLFRTWGKLVTSTIQRILTNAGSENNMPQA